MSLRPLLTRIGKYLGAAYALAAAALCVWIVSFAPTEGPALSAFMPAKTGLIVHVRDGAELTRLAAENKALNELLNDPDFREAFGSVLSQRDQALQKYRGLPALVQRLVPPTLKGVYPFVGRECALALCGEPGTSSHPALLILTRLSGVQGQLLRLGARFAKAPKNVELFNLDGDVFAIGLNGAQPGTSGVAGLASGGSQSGARPLATLLLFPKNLPSRPAAPKTEAPKLSANAQALLQGFSEEYLHDNIGDPAKPVSLAEMFDLAELPASVRLDFFESGGGLSVSGKIDGVLPAVAESSGSAEAGAFAEGLFPFDARACFLNYLGNIMKSPRRKRRWLVCLEDIEDQAIELKTDLWPKLGHWVHFSFQEAPENFGSAEYGLLNARLTFDGSNPKARNAIGELVRGRWDVVEGKGDNGITSQYLRLVRGENSDRYILVTKEIMAPTWTVNEHEITLLSDAGPFALLERSGGAPPPAAPAPPPPLGTGKPRSFFLRVDGERMASKMETWATKYYNDIEEDMASTKEFLENYPDAAVQIKLARKLSSVLGKFSLEVTPEPGGESAAVRAVWSPGTLQARDEKNNDSAPPPPPPN